MIFTIKNAYFIKETSAGIILPGINGLVCWLDIEDLDVALEMPGTIYASVPRRDHRTRYAMYHESVSGKQRTFYFHHRIIEAMAGMCVDHIDGDVLNNRRSNLIRSVSQAINNLNCGVSTKNTSGMRGVHFHQRSAKWRAQIGKNGKLVSIGLFENKIDAYSAYKNELGALDQPSANRA